MSETNGRRPHLIFAIFTISGFSGLIYESIWSHYLKLFLGHAAYAQTLVLAIFMGGMAIGSWLMAKYSHRVTNLLLGYAIVEGVIGLFGLVFHNLSVGATNWAFDSLLPNFDSVAGAQLAKWTLGAVLILPQSILLGMTFPLMSGAIVRRFPQRSGETLAMLYFTNSLGAAIGVLFSGFVLIDLVGLPGTIMTAGLLNIGLALFVWGIVKYQPDMVVSSAPSHEQATGAAAVAPPILRWMLIGAAATGVASFLYEIAWIRMLSLVLGSSTHSFEMMLSAFILGIALGGFWVHRKIDGMRDPVRFLSTILIIMAIVAMLSLPVYTASFDLMAQVIQTFASTDQGYVGRSIASNVIAMLVMIPTTFFCGMTLPIITHVLLRNGAGERAIGAVYAWNTAGAIVGVFLAVHLLMPLIGVKGVVIVGAALQLALAALYRSQSTTIPHARKHAAGVALAGTVALVAGVAFLHLDPAKMASGVYRHGLVHKPGEVTFLEHGRTATISLVDIDGVISIATNGKPDAALNMGEGPPNVDEITMVLAGAIPFALRDDSAQVANIGFGSGLTSHVLLSNPEVERLDTIEIEPVMAKAARAGFLKRVSRVFEDPRSHIHYEDAKTYFAMHRSQYDVIVSEPSNPWVSGVATLFSREFYQQMKRYLKDDGMLVQWIQIYETDITVIKSIIRALAPEFEDFAIYNTDDTNLLIVAVRKGSLPGVSDRPFAIEGTRAELARVGIMSVNDIESRFIGNKAMLVPMIEQSGVPANSDYFPYVDLNAARFRILGRNAIELTQLQTLPVPFLDLFRGYVPTREESRPTEIPSSRRDRMLAEAQKIREAILLGKFDTLHPAVAVSLLALQSSAADCAKPAVRIAWMTSVELVASNTTAPLSPKELAPMWEKIVQSPCGQALDDQESRLVEFIRAVAARDTTRVANLGTAMLSGDQKFEETTQYQFVLLATATSELASGRPAIAHELIRKQAGKVQHGPVYDLALQIVSASARGQGMKGQGAKDDGRYSAVRTGAVAPSPGGGTN